MEEQTQEQPQLPQIKIAFVLDGEVVDILHTDERLAAIFTSSPLIVDVTGQLVENGGIVKVGTKWSYESEQFIAEEQNG
jgi:predicted acetyltransferase